MVTYGRLGPCRHFGNQIPVGRKARPPCRRHLVAPATQGASGAAAGAGKRPVGAHFPATVHRQLRVLAA